MTACVLCAVCCVLCAVCCVLCAVCRFSDAGVTDYPGAQAAGVRKAPRHEIAGRGTDWAVPRAQLWGFGRVLAAAEVGSEVGECWRWRCGLGATGFSDLR